MMMNIKTFVSILFFSFSALVVHAQECTLDIGGKNSEILIKVFQLNEVQITQMNAWSAELAETNKVVENEIQKLFDSHPQSTPDELTTLAEKYKALQSKMVNASREVDKNLLTIFNERQYDRYLQLCAEAIRLPIKVIPISVSDSLVVPE